MPGHDRSTPISDPNSDTIEPIDFFTANPTGRGTVADDKARRLGFLAGRPLLIGEAPHEGQAIFGEGTRRP